MMITGLRNPNTTPSGSMIKKKVDPKLELRDYNKKIYSGPG